MIVHLGSQLLNLKNESLRPPLVLCLRLPQLCEDISRGQLLLIVELERDVVP